MKNDKYFSIISYYRRPSHLLDLAKGVVWAAEEFGIKHIEIEPGADADRETGLRMIASQGFDLVLGVGFLFTDAISAVADEFPDTKFAIIDGFIDGKANVSSLLFTEQDGSFLVGIIAGMKAMDDGKDRGMRWTSEGRV